MVINIELRVKGRKEDCHSTYIDWEREYPALYVPTFGRGGGRIQGELTRRVRRERYEKVQLWVGWRNIEADNRRIKIAFESADLVDIDVELMQSGIGICNSPHIEKRIVDHLLTLDD